MVVSVGISLGLLGYFKYANFFMDNLQAVLGTFHIQMNVPKFDIFKITQKSNNFLYTIQMIAD